MLDNSDYLQGNTKALVQLDEGEAAMSFVLRKQHSVARSWTNYVARQVLPCCTSQESSPVKPGVRADSLDRAQPIPSLPLYVIGDVRGRCRKTDESDVDNPLNPYLPRLGIVFGISSVNPAWFSTGS